MIFISAFFFSSDFNICYRVGLSGTRPIKSSKSVNIDPKFIFYNAFDKKQIAKLYSAIWETTETLFLYLEVDTIFQNALLTHVL